jgi:hypothetical protein
MLRDARLRLPPKAVDRTKGCALDLNSTALAYHAQFAELDAHNSEIDERQRVAAMVSIPFGRI